MVWNNILWPTHATQMMTLFLQRKPGKCSKRLSEVSGCTEERRWALLLPASLQPLTSLVVSDKKRKTTLPLQTLSTSHPWVSSQGSTAFWGLAMQLQLGSATCTAGSQPEDDSQDKNIRLLLRSCLWNLPLPPPCLSLNWNTTSSQDDFLSCF